MADRFDKFTQKAREVFSTAKTKAEQNGQEHIGPEHVLLALVEDQGTRSAQILANLGGSKAKITEAFAMLIQPGTHTEEGQRYLTPEVKEIMRLAVDEAKRLNHNIIGTEHLLLGLRRHENNAGAAILESIGISLERVRAETIRVLSTTKPGSELEKMAQPDIETLMSQAIQLASEIPIEWLVLGQRNPSLLDVAKAHTNGFWYQIEEVEWLRAALERFLRTRIEQYEKKTHRCFTVTEIMGYVSNGLIQNFTWSDCTICQDLYELFGKYLRPKTEEQIPAENTE